MNFSFRRIKELEQLIEKNEASKELISKNETLNKMLKKSNNLYAQLLEENQNLMDDLMEFLGRENEGTPTVIIGDEVLVGYGDNMQDTYKNALESQKENDYSLESNKNLVISLLDHLKITKCSFVGFSYGCAVAALIAHTRIELVNN